MYEIPQSWSFIYRPIRPYPTLFSPNPRVRPAHRWTTLCNNWAFLLVPYSSTGCSAKAILDLTLIILTIIDAQHPNQEHTRNSSQARARAHFLLSISTSLTVSRRLKQRRLSESRASVTDPSYRLMMLILMDIAPRGLALSARVVIRRVAEGGWSMWIQDTTVRGTCGRYANR